MGVNSTQRIAATVRAAMTENKITQVALSEATGIPRVTLVRRISGHSPFKVDELERVAAHLGLDLADVLAGAA